MFGPRRGHRCIKSSNNSNCKRQVLNLDVTAFYMPVYGHSRVSVIRPGVYAGLKGRNARNVSLVYEAPEFAFTV